MSKIERFRRQILQSSQRSKQSSSSGSTKRTDKKRANLVSNAIGFERILEEIDGEDRIG